MEFNIYDSSVVEDRDGWLEYYKLIPHREPTSHPEYIRLFLKPSETSICACYRDTGGIVIFPLVLRSLSSEKWVKQHCGYFDLVSPYQYGGAFFHGKPDVKNFWKCFDDWIINNNVVSLVVRLSLFNDQILPFMGEILFRSQNIVRSLTLSIEDIWRQFEQKVRKNVNRAQRENLQIFIDKDGKKLEDFLKVYYSTMSRRGANAEYYFNKSFFQNLINAVPENICFFHVLDEQEVISTELVLISEKYIYSFLGGTAEKAFDKRPNDFLKFEIIKWGQENKKVAFILGGGYEPDDGIFRFKQSFAPNGEIPFNIGIRIYNPVMYNNLIEQRQEYEKKEGRNWIPRSTYFPLYRA